ncbi:hypothetical protein Y032_0119g839 [Ancylostoma ceylanicum]|uniref:Uncharacterized protein n=1 Tax=Ancylostoma ceylanicum TaxID=53326 RepID=A0A016TBA6_9BILA|nr:hypothetical protein Y032_0119g839 [Ancylostoma ceylanicum]
MTDAKGKKELKVFILKTKTQQTFNVGSKERRNRNLYEAIAISPPFYTLLSYWYASMNGEKKMVLIAINLTHYGP